jgi:hypothetical protein
VVTFIRRVACVCQQLLEGYCAETLALSKSTLVLRVRALSLIERRVVARRVQQL